MTNPSAKAFIAGAVAAAATLAAYRVLRKAVDGPLAPAAPGKNRYLLYGKNGWIGGILIEMLRKDGKEVYLSDCRTENRESVRAELEKIKPTHVINAAGTTGVPNVDWYFFFFNFFAT